MADRLSLYNDALMLCGDRSLSSLTEEREPRRLLDQVWNSGGVDRCLEDAQWHFAMRTVHIDYDPDIQPDFGYTRAFTKPTDWLLTSALCVDDRFQVPLNQYFDEKDFWYSDMDEIFVRYISNDPLYGMDLGKWPHSFTEFVTAHFASRIILKLSKSQEKFKELHALRERFKKEAKGRAAMAEPTSFPAKGSWVRSRTRGSQRGDRGNTGSLIG